MRRITGLVASSLLLGGVSAFAFELLRVDSNPCGSATHLYWAARTVGVNAGALQPSEYAQLAEDGRLRWNQSLPGGFQFGSGTGGFCNLSDGVATLGFSTTDCNGASFAGDIVAATTSRFNLRTGQLVDADIVFDVNEPIFDNANIFREVAMHELGHVLGLAHSDACGASGAGTLMRTTIRVSDPRLGGPQADDIAGANFIYPPGDGGEAPAASGCGIGQNREHSFISLIFLLVLLGIRRGRPASAGQA